MKKTFLTVSLILSLAFCSVLADDYVDDAYYWDGAVRVERSATPANDAASSTKASNDAVTTKVKKVPVTIREAEPLKATSKVQSTKRPVTPKVEFIQVKDTVVKAVVHRNNQ